MLITQKLFWGKTNSHQTQKQLEPHTDWDNCYNPARAFREIGPCNPNDW